jgi:hypothetical protein
MPASGSGENSDNEEDRSRFDLTRDGYYRWFNSVAFS